MTTPNRLLREAEEFVCAVVGENQPSRAWAVELRTKLSAAIAGATPTPVPGVSEAMVERAEAAWDAEVKKGQHFKTRLRAALEAAVQSPPAGGCKCQGCGNRYVADLIVPDEAWAQISPKGVDGDKGGGLLCPSCIMHRIVDAGIWTVGFASASPPAAGREAEYIASRVEAVATEPVETSGNFKLGDIVETVKGAKFWGEIIAFDNDEALHGCTVRALDHGFLGTKHVYPLKQLRLRPLYAPSGDSGALREALAGLCNKIEYIADSELSDHDKIHFILKATRAALAGEKAP